MFLQLIHASRQVNVTAIDRTVSFAQYSNITVNGHCSLLSSCLRPTHSAICLTSAHDALFEPYWTSETDRIMFLQHCLECWNESWYSRFFEILCSHEIFGFRSFWATLVGRNIWHFFDMHGVPNWSNQMHYVYQRECQFHVRYSTCSLQQLHCVRRCALNMAENISKIFWRVSKRAKRHY